MTEAKAGSAPPAHPGTMTPTALLSLSGVAIMAAAGLSAALAVLIGALLWLGVPLPLEPPLPPQTLVVGGMFLAVPVAMLGYGMVWAAGWFRIHR